MITTATATSKFVNVRLGDFALDNVEAPVEWSDNAIAIAAAKYFRAGERSVFDLVQRVSSTIGAKGYELGYFDTQDSCDRFVRDLSEIQLSQRAAFNSPVYFNVGVEATPQCWACLILSVDDNMESLKRWINVEIDTFRRGSGSGVNISRVRHDGAPLSNGKGVASGPVSFMRIADASAGVVKSGGRTRRAAKMVIMDADHQDIREFVESKVKAERMARLMQANGFDVALNGKDSLNVPFQNANHSVRVTDEFMRLDTPEKVELFGLICQAAWECGDPGLQFHDTINRAHTCKADGEITASNPCSEYMFLDDTVCNLASLNLMKYRVDHIPEHFNYPLMRDDIQVLVTAQDIIVDLSSYPTHDIEQKNKEYRTIGLGYTNLGALLMSLGLPYDSDTGRQKAATITELMEAHAWQASYQLANKLGPYPAWERNHVRHLNILQSKPLCMVAPMRNAQISVIAPTGTISFMMDCETTGIEPVLAIAASKDLVGGGSVDVGVNECVKMGLEALGINSINEKSEVFQTALGDNVVSPEGHVRMMAAVQPYISGAISKTVNLPASATPEDVGRIYKLAHELGVKAIAVFRDGSKAYQPVNQAGSEAEDRGEEYIPEIKADTTGGVYRERPPGTRQGTTHKFQISGEEFYLTANRFPDGRLCEIFIKGAKQGTAITGLLDALSISVSIGLQCGMKIEQYAKHFASMKFEPSGIVVSDSDIHFADSVVDYAFRYLMQGREMPVDPHYAGRTRPSAPAVVDFAPTVDGVVQEFDCLQGVGRCKFVKSGSCFACPKCGETTGCS